MRKITYYSGKKPGCFLSALLCFVFIMALLLIGSAIEIFAKKVGQGWFCFIVSFIGVLSLFLIICSIYANSLVKKHKVAVVLKNETINSCSSLECYFVARDELIALLNKMTRFEGFIKKKNRFIVDGKPIKPSNLMKVLAENEELSINSAINRSALRVKEVIRSSGCCFSSNFEEQIKNYQDRMSGDNYNNAVKWLEIIRRYERIVGRIEEVDDMEGHEFEYWCAELLSRIGFKNVEVTQGSGDQGVDVIAEKEGIHYAIQCKCYSSDLGNAPVQEVNTGKAIYDCQIGAVMTNRYFTRGAKEAAKANGILLWDRDKLMEWLNVTHSRTER